MSDQLTARDIQRALMAERYRRGLTIPNFTPRGWWECDVFEITKAGYFREYEIKLSRADFLADSRKSKGAWALDGMKWNEKAEAKHSLLEQRSFRGPTRFWFVVPAGLVEPREVPEWAGLMTAHPFGDDDYPSSWPGRCTVGEAKVAPQLHRSKVDPQIKSYAESICYYRFMNIFLYGRTQPDAHV